MKAKVWCGDGACGSFSIVRHRTVPAPGAAPARPGPPYSTYT